MRILFSALWLAAALLCLAPCASAAMTRQDIIDLHKKSFENLRKGDSEAAYAGYLRLLREEPGNPDIDFMMGQAAFAQGNYPMAVFAYIRVIKVNPRHERARLELARTYNRMGEPELARMELDALRVINSSLPQVAEMEKAIRETPYSPWAFRATLGAGMFYDSNANMGTSASEYLGFILTEGKSKESLGMYSSGMLDLAYRLGRESSWYLVGDVSASDREYFNRDLVDGRLTYGQAAFGLRRVLEKGLAEIRGKGDFLDREEGFVTQNRGAEVTFIYSLTTYLISITQASYEYRQYAPGYKDMRGTHSQMAQYVRLQFGESQHEMLLGGSYFFENAREKRYDGQGCELLGRVQFNLPWQMKTGFLAAWRGTWYDAPPTALGGGDRLERQFRAGIEFEKGLTDSLSLNTQAQYTRNSSNHSLHRYSQWLLTAGFSYAF